jgi:hypothetical protein
MFKKYLKYIFLALSLLVAVGILVNKYAKQEYLNFLAQYYFDEQYYLAEYPEVRNSGILPFEHYTQIGWKEDKNPSAEFDAKLYRNLYLLAGNKYNLSPLADYVDSKIKFEKRLINSKQIKKAEPLANPKYYLSLVALFQNEARFLKEWIEFYKMIGVEHFYLYNHLSEDNYLEVLQPYIDQGVVELFDITEKLTNSEQWNKLQTGTYESTAKKVADQTEWLIIVDTDEFLFPVKEKNLADVLKKYDEYAALSINWKVFGTANIQKIPEDKLFIETLVYTSAPEFNDRQVKTIVKPRYVERITNPHYPKLYQGYLQVTENFEYFRKALTPEASRNILRINHYYYRDLEFFQSRKLNRMHVMDKKLSKEYMEAQMQRLKDSNKQDSTTYDDAILKYVPELRERVFGIAKF